MKQKQTIMNKIISVFIGKITFSLFIGVVSAAIWTVDDNVTTVFGWTGTRYEQITGA